MIDPGWKNPYILTLATRGYYHFWPAYNEAKMSGADAATFEVRFEHQKLQSQTISITVKINRKKDFIMVKPIPLVLMKLKEGISPDFLDA